MDRLASMIVMGLGLLAILLRRVGPGAIESIAFRLRGGTSAGSRPTSARDPIGTAPSPPAFERHLWATRADADEGLLWSVMARIAPPVVDRDVAKLAPHFRRGVEAALAECAAAGIDAIVYECCRSDELQALYYARGRTIVPPYATVTNAPSSLYSWHGYGLAVDIVSRANSWQPPGGVAWFRAAAAIFGRHDCAWGGEWRRPDPPHFQWHLCKPSPSDEARRIRAREGDAGVWRAVGAA